MSPRRSGGSATRSKRKSVRPASGSTSPSAIRAIPDVLAIECDGATYHSALWARERDRLRQEVLEGLGWRIHRIWSTDWFYRRDEQLRKLKEELDAARGDMDKMASAATLAPTAF